ncbi:MAG: branched-chain amino acid ABC transporter permease [Chloroflexota bacterium]|nr:branched-chain amino acid ABC transporter permease [Chloroflexota bacterium]
MAGATLGFLTLALLPLRLSGYAVQVLMIGYFFVLLGVSWNLLAGFTGQFSLAQHAFATIGGYVSAAASVGLNVPLPMAILAGALVAALIGFGLGWLTLGMRGIYFAIATWAFAESVRILLSINYQLTRGDMGLPVPFLFQTPDPLPTYELFLVVTALAVLLNAWLLRTKMGYRMRAIRDDQELALAVGIDVVAWKRWVFVVSTALAGLAGALYGHAIGLLTPSQAHFSQMAFVVIAVVLGGFRSLWGPLVGGLLAQGLAELLRFSVEARLIVFAVVVILIMRLYPPGVVGAIAAISQRVRQMAARRRVRERQRAAPAL